MKRLRYGLVPVLLFTTSVLMAEESSYVKGSQQISEPLQVIVTGVKGQELRNVELALTLPPGLIHEGKVDRLWLERFKNQIPEKVRQALEPFGYYGAQTKVSLEHDEEGTYKLYVTIEPGKPVIVKSLRVSVQGPGSNQRSLQEFVRAFPLKEGDILRQDKYEEAKETIKTEALNLGYLDADFVLHVIRLARADESAQIELVLETGPRYYFGEVRIEGDPDYPDRFLRRYLSFDTGEAFSYSKIYQTQLNFNNSDRFEEVLILPEKESAEDFRVPVQIRLVSSRPKRLRVGLGYGTDTGARFTANYQDLNFQRRGHEFHAEANLSQRLQSFIARYVWPSFTDLESFTSLRGGILHERVKTYESRSLLVEPEHVRSLGGGKLVSGYLQVRMEDFTIGEQEGSSRLVMPGLRFSERHYDDLVRPRNGYRYGGELRGTDQLLGSDTKFLQLLMNGDLVTPLPLQFSLLMRAQGGFTLLSDPLHDLPPSVRFFAGGDRSVRGYAYQSLGPKDSEGKVMGGKHLLAGSIELERPISRIFDLAAFYDVGNAFNDLGSVDLHQGVGIGVRVYTPVGPIRLDLARQVAVKDPDFRIHFTVGFTL